MNVRTMAAVALLSLAAGPSATRAAEGSFVGALKGAPAGARVGIVADGDKVLAYVCGDDAAFNAAHARWFRGPLAADGRFRLEADGQTLSGRVEGGSATGELAAAGEKALHFRAAAVPADGAAGVYRDEEFVGDDKAICGWVVDADGSAVGAVKTRGGVKTLPPGRAPGGLTLPNGTLPIKGSVTGQRLSGLQEPLPGQVFRGVVTAIDPARRIITLNQNGKLVKVPVTRPLVVVDENGQETPEDLASPRKVQISGTITIKIGKVKIVITIG